jgi:hypothetical protein
MIYNNNIKIFLKDFLLFLNLLNADFFADFADFLKTFYLY